MDYFELLNLRKEPFSNSPDPDFFYPSPEHIRCLQKLELAVRLRRGLNVVVGKIGTGKTTLCRHLIREFSADESLETHLILDPDFHTPTELLASLAEFFNLPIHLQAEDSKWQIKESIKNYLFEKGVEEEKTVILIIDEGQKIPSSCLEILRELLNYETNEHKLLQIIIFAQEEFRQTLAEHPSFSDRINFYHVLAPLSFRETRNLLQFRLNQAKDGYKEPNFFTPLGMLALYRATEGYPRRIIHLSHRVLLTLIIQNRTRAGWSLVRWCSKMSHPREPLQTRWGLAPPVLVLLVLIMLAAYIYKDSWQPFLTEFLNQKGSSSHHVIPAPESLASKRAKIPAPTNTVLTSEEKLVGAQSAAPQNETAHPQEGISSSPDVQADSSVVQPQTPEPSFQTAGSAQPAQIISQTPREALPVEFHPPDVLGQVTARPGDTLEKMIRRVYGTFDQQYLKAVTQLNPQLGDPNALEAGKLIKFPPLPVRADALPNDGRYVQVLQANTLNEACKLLRLYPTDGPPVFLLPYWNSKDGLKFGIMLKDCCADQHSAEASLRTLPAPLAPGAKIIGKQDENAVFLLK